MEHEETYHGRRFVVTTSPAAEGGWTARADRVDGEQRVTLATVTPTSYSTEPEAHRAALSAAVAAIDRSRTSRGKP